MIEIKYPMQIDPVGRIAFTTDYEQIWKQRVLAVLSTQSGSRVMRPEYGVGLDGSLFLPQAEVEDGAGDTLTAALQTSLPEIIVEEVQTVFDEDSGVLTVTLFFRLPNRQRSSTIVTINQSELAPYAALNTMEGQV